jgi:subtilisin family serine protease
VWTLKGFVSFAALAIIALSAGTPLAPGSSTPKTKPPGAPPRAATGTETTLPGFEFAGPFDHGPVLGAASEPSRFVPGVVLVGFRPGVSSAQRYSVERAVGAEGAKRLGPHIRPVGHGRVLGQQYMEPLELRVPATQVLAVVHRLRENRAVAYAEPDYLMQGSSITPSNPDFAPYQWADNNTGQSVPTQESEENLGPPEAGTPGDDDNALAAWQVTTGSRSIVVGEVDTGVDYTHPDLAANIWSNPGGIGGCAAGTHGYNVLEKNCNPMDTESSPLDGHGTHVAGIIGAVGNSGIGVVGMNWETTILPVRWMEDVLYGETSALIEALQWLVKAKQAGVNLRVVNDSASFVGTASSQALSNEIETLGANDILFVSAAGNSGANDDEVAVRRYPCGYDLANEICVTSTNNKDELPDWANYGPERVDMAAPGVSIYSTEREDKYGYISGASTAAPQVSGAAALVLSVEPSLSATELKADILGNVDPLPALAGKVRTGGDLDVCKAIPGCLALLPPPPARQPTMSASPESAPTNLTGANSYPSGVVTCKTVAYRVHSKPHWIWVAKTRNVRGHIVLARRRGKIVYVRVRVSYVVKHKKLCSSRPPA